MPDDGELRRFRAEAEEVLDIAPALPIREDAPEGSYSLPVREDAPGA